MAKLKFIDKQGQISVRLKLSSSERINNNEVMFFSKDFSRGFMRPNPEDSSKILFTGAKGVPLSRFLKRNINKDHFYMMIAQLLEAYKAVIHFKLHPAKVVLDLDFIIINENTGELFLIYQPVLNSPALNKGFMNCFSQIASAAKFADNQDRTSVNNFMAFAGRMPNFSVNELEKFIMGASPVTYTIVPRQTYGAQQSGVLNKPPVPQSTSTATFQRPAQTAAPLTPEAPKAEEKKSEPVKEEKAPETPKVEEKKSEPVKEEKAPEAPKVEEKKPEPVKEEKAPEAPKAEEKKSEPVKEEKTPEAPKVEEKKSEPVKEEKVPEAPKVEEKKSEPVKEEKAPEAPKAEEKKSEPVKEEKTPEAPKVEEKKSEPVKEEKAPEAPKVEEKKSEPIKEEKTPEALKVEEKKSEPVKEEKTPEAPKVEEKKSEPVKEEKTPEAPKAEEKKPEPVKEEKAPETPKIEEKKSEPIKEEKAPEAPKVEEKKHGRKVVIKHVKVKAVSAKKNAEHKLTVEAPVEKAPEEPKVEEKKSEPVKEEKAPDKAMENVKEIPKVEEKKPEPVKEEKKPVMEAAPEKPSFSYAEQFGAEDEGTVVLNDYSRSTMADLPTAKLIRRSNKETAIITKHVFTIGKERARVDYCVTNNRTVSRFHATIYRRTDGYYVVDNNSTNRTFVNGSPIPVQTEIRLRNGDILRLSNEEFDFIEE